ncbi:hypothetical protein CMI40_02575 [Candidatus Pacearchaeota archaeon]|jgi:hypothetical protein|nr:hypothetical protein [Candidatus Pacearchaeota archaeon]|tara:strand:- start:9392 stop:9820 length:429 start_codon:yes stop_codon:yes gene_type:complete
MIKRRVVKKIGSIKRNTANTSKNNNVEKVLIENFISLQRVMTNLSLKFDHLTNQISKLLELFEISAKSLAEKNMNLEDDNQKINRKIDSLADQNKTIARGLTLMNDKNPQQNYQSSTPQIPQNQNTEYQKSISSGFKQLPKK